MTAKAVRPRPAFLKVGSAEGCQELREKEMRIGGRLLLAILNLWVVIKLLMAAVVTNHSVTVSTQSVASSVHKLPDSVDKSASIARHTLSMCQE